MLHNLIYFIDPCTPSIIHTSIFLDAETDRKFSYCFPVLQLFREVKIMKMLNHPNIGMLSEIILVSLRLSLNVFH